MKAVGYTRYGLPDDLKLMEAALTLTRTWPSLGVGFSISINSWDWDKVKGILFARIDGLFKPGTPILGCDIAGVVEQVGDGVDRLKVGDHVYGDISSGGKWGGFAEYVATEEHWLATKPEDMSFEVAAALPQAGVLALQALRWNGEVKTGDVIIDILK